MVLYVQPNRGRIEGQEGEGFMLHFFEQQGNHLLFRENGETVMISPWGKNSFRIRAAFLGEIDEGSIALLEVEEEQTQIEIEEWKAEITNGNIKAELIVQPWAEPYRCAFIIRRESSFYRKLQMGVHCKEKPDISNRCLVVIMN